MSLIFVWKTLILQILADYQAEWSAEMAEIEGWLGEREAESLG